MVVLAEQHLVVTSICRAEAAVAFRKRVSGLAEESAVETTAVSGERAEIGIQPESLGGFSEVAAAEAAGRMIQRAQL